MLYITGVHALNINCELETCGDWHQSALRWDNMQLVDSDNMFFKEYGIEENKSIPEHTEKYNVANHIRALLDLLQQRKYSIAQGMNDDFICNEKYDEEIFDKVFEMSVLEHWDEIDDFMGREYFMKWINYKINKKGKGTMVKLEFVFNKNALEECEATEEDVLYKVISYAEENGIKQSSVGVFETDREDAVALLTKIITDIVCDNLVFLGFLDDLFLYVDGEKEDCIENIEKWERGKGNVELGSALDNYFIEHNNKKKLNGIEFKIDSSKWNLVSEKGYPEEHSWCFVIFKSLRGGYDYFVGGYFPDKKEFWVNFGLGGAVIDEKDVVAWAPFDGDYLSFVK